MIVGGTPKKPVFQYTATQDENDRLGKLNILLMTFDLPIRAYSPDVPIVKGRFRLRKKRSLGGTKRTYDTIDQLEVVVHGILNDPDLLEKNRNPGRLISPLENW